MQAKSFNLMRYDADENKVFDWKDLSKHQIEDEDGNIIQQHLYAKTLFISNTDDILNYIEVDAPVEEENLEEGASE